MSTVRRVAPEILFCIGCHGNHREPDDECGICLGLGVAIETAKDEKRFKDQCLQDLAAGRHAVGCECSKECYHQNCLCIPENACTLIVRCALEMRDYQVEVEDAQVP